MLDKKRLKKVIRYLKKRHRGVKKRIRYLNNRYKFSAVMDSELNIEQNRLQTSECRHIAMICDICDILYIYTVDNKVEFYLLNDTSEEFLRDFLFCLTLTPRDLEIALKGGWIDGN